MKVPLNAFSVEERNLHQERMRAFEAAMWDIIWSKTLRYGPNKPILIPSEKPE